MRLSKVFLSTALSLAMASLMCLNQAQAQSNDSMNQALNTPQMMERIRSDNQMLNDRLVERIKKDNVMLNTRFNEQMMPNGKAMTRAEMTDQMRDDWKRNLKTWDERMMEQRANERKMHYDQMMADYQKRPLAQSKKMNDRLEDRMKKDDG